MTDKNEQQKKREAEAKAAEIKRAEAAQDKKMSDAKASGDADGKKVAAGAGETGEGIRSGFNGLVDGIKGIFSGSKKDENGQDVEEKDEQGNPKKKSGIGEWFKSLNVGGLTGGILGVMGAWFVGSTFGGGIIGTIASALLSLGGFFIGQKFGNNTINGWLGRDQNGKPVEKGQEQVVQQAVAPNAPVQQQAQVQTTAPAPAQNSIKPLTNDEILAIQGRFREEMKKYQDSPNPRFQAVNVESAPNGPAFAPDTRSAGLTRLQ